MLAVVGFPEEVRNQIVAQEKNTCRWRKSDCSFPILHEQWLAECWKLAHAV